MGIILLPLLLYSVYIFINSLMSVVGLIKQKEIYFSEIASGLVLSIIILGGLVFKYYKANGAMFVEIVFEVCIYAIILPFFVYQMANKQSSLGFVSHMILISLIFSGLLGLCLQEFLAYLLRAKQ